MVSVWSARPGAKRTASSSRRSASSSDSRSFARPWSRTSIHHRSRATLRLRARSAGLSPGRRGGIPDRRRALPSHHTTPPPIRAPTASAAPTGIHHGVAAAPAGAVAAGPSAARAGPSATATGTTGVGRRGRRRHGQLEWADGLAPVARGSRLEGRELDRPELQPARLLRHHRDPPGPAAVDAAVVHHDPDRRSQAGRPRNPRRSATATAPPPAADCRSLRAQR